MDDFNIAQIIVPAVTGIVGWMLDKVVIGHLGVLIEKASEAFDVVIEQAEKVDDIHDKLIVRGKSGKTKKRRCSPIQGEGSDLLGD